MSTLLVASTGGHLDELIELAPRLPDADGDVLWVTNRTEQSESALRDRTVEFVPAVGARDARGALLGSRRAHRLHGRHRFDTVVSTGSGIALAYLPYLALRGVDTYYVESATRVTGLSVTGRVLKRAPRVQVLSQYRERAGIDGGYAGSVFDGFDAGADARAAGRAPKIRRAVVTLGTMEPGFRGLLERLTEMLPPGVQTLWQTGHTDVSGLPIDATPWVPQADLARAMGEADLVIAHAGVGSSLMALKAGRLPVLVPREQARGEVLDDHQTELAQVLGDRGLAIARRLPLLTISDLHRAATRHVGRGAVPAMELGT